MLRPYSDQSFFGRDGNRLRAIARAERRHDLFDRAFDRALAAMRLLRDLFIRRTVRY